MLREMEPLYRLIQVLPAYFKCSHGVLIHDMCRERTCMGSGQRISSSSGGSDICLQDMSELKSRLTAYLRQHGQLASAFSVQRTPGLLGDFIELTGNAVRMHLLARHMPYKHIIQLYALVYNTVEVRRSALMFCCRFNLSTSGQWSCLCTSDCLDLQKSEILILLCASSSVETLF